MVGKFTAERLTAFFTAIIAVTGVFALVYAHLQLREALSLAKMLSVANAFEISNFQEDEIEACAPQEISSF